MRIALFGGSFDPPHRAHLAVARAAIERVGLGRVLFAPVGLQPLKGSGAAASFGERVEMVRLAIAGQAGFELSLVDAPLGDAPNYTAESLERLGGEMPGDELYLLMGADSLRSLRGWHRAEEIPFLARLIVAARPGEQLEDVGAIQACMPEGLHVERDGVDRFLISNGAGFKSELALLSGLAYDVSATGLRELMHEGGGAAEAEIPEAVLGYIRERGLYRQDLLRKMQDA